MAPAVTAAVTSAPANRSARRTGAAVPTTAAAAMADTTGIVATTAATAMAHTTRTMPLAASTAMAHATGAVSAAVRRRAVIPHGGSPLMSVGVPLYGAGTMSAVTAMMLSISDIRRQQNEQ